LKIYPAFYVLIVVTGVATAVGWTRIPTGTGNYLREVAFLQNYGPGLWDHTWSLAVEEHFYIGLALLLMVMMRLSPQRHESISKSAGDLREPGSRLPGAAWRYIVAVPERALEDSASGLQHDAHAGG
jgi:peptidoglycan/LPS O-acetylase OafA/YrhL